MLHLKMGDFITYTEYYMNGSTNYEVATLSYDSLGIYYAKDGGACLKFIKNKFKYFDHETNSFEKFHYL
jgi:hypothetical protein